jgi:hypothetical protein
MNPGLFGYGYLLICGLILAGVALLALSFELNRRLEFSVLNKASPLEKRYEYYRGTATQLGILLIGIGVSLFIFFFQQTYQEGKRRDAEIQQVLAKLASRLGRASADLQFLPEYDEILDDGGPYIDPDERGDNAAVTASGADLAKQIENLRLIERDVSQDDFTDLEFSADLQGSPLITELDPALWFAMHREENELKYAIKQLSADFKDLGGAVGEADPVQAVSDAAMAKKVKREVLDILYDLDLLRDRSRRSFARACWLVSQGHDFVSLHPLQAISQSYNSHQKWIEQAKLVTSSYRVGGESCYDMLSFKEPKAAGTPSVK